MTLIYQLNDREDLSNLMTTTNSRLITPVEIAQVRLCRPSVYDRKYQCVIMWSGMTSCLCIYTNVRASCQAQPIVPRPSAVFDLDSDGSPVRPVRHISAVRPPIDLSPPTPAKRVRRVVLDGTP